MTDELIAGKDTSVYASVKYRIKEAIVEEVERQAEEQRRLVEDRDALLEAVEAFFEAERTSIRSGRLADMALADGAKLRLMDAAQRAASWRATRPAHKPPWHWEYHPTTGEPIALAGPYGDILIATGDGSRSWIETSRAHLDLIASAPELLAENTLLRGALDRIVHAETDALKAHKAATLGAAALDRLSDGPGTEHDLIRIEELKAENKRLVDGLVGALLLLEIGDFRNGNERDGFDLGEAAANRTIGQIRQALRPPP
jgi:hypothetical protein